MSNYTLKQRYFMLATIIELRIYCGYSITDLIGKPLSYFNFEYIEQSIKDLEKEKANIDGHEY